MNLDELTEKYNIKYLDFTFDYAEPGYTLPEGKLGILFANWNDVPQETQATLESEYELEWEDEWTTCSNCGKALRTSPNSYHWQASYYMGDGELLCLECLDFDDILTDYVNNPRHALTWPLFDALTEDDLIARGFVRFNGDFEVGWYPGQNADPETIYKTLRKDHAEVLFAMTDQGQFDVTFSTYTRDPQPDDDHEVRVLPDYSHHGEDE